MNYSDLTLLLKFSLNFQALYKAKSIEPHNTLLFTRIVDFASTCFPDDSCPPSVREVITSQTKSLLGGKTVMEFVCEARNRALEDAKCSLDTRLAIAKTLVSTGAGVPTNANVLILDGGVHARNATVDNCKEALNYFSDFGLEEEKSRWILLVKERFPLAKGFD